MLHKIFIVSSILLAAGLAIHFGCSLFNYEKSQIDLQTYKKDGWFGKGNTILKDSTEIRPFKVNVSDKDLEDLKYRLTNARYTDHITGTHFTYGFNSEYLKQVIEYWQTKYDWRKEEAKLNAYPQFVTQIEGLDVHYVHVKPNKPAKTVLPLLVIHGWPGSVLEYYKSFPLLTEPDDNGLAFEVIAPSIPGYGFSEAPHQKGFNITAAARVFVKLMKRLGHEKFVVHGGDWGNIITRFMGAVYYENAVGVHILGNMNFGMANSPKQMLKTLIAAYFPTWYFGAENAAKEYDKMFPLSDKFAFALAESGYMHIQATKPDTVGSALVDSPVGLAAYILEKFSTWTNPAYRELEDGGLTKKFTLDELLTNVMIYWTSGNIASSQRFYKENIIDLDKYSSLQIKAPAATVDTPFELMRSPRVMIEHKFDHLLQYSEFPRAGHFVAFEEPKLVCDDIRKFVKKLIAFRKTKKVKHDEI